MKVSAWETLSCDAGWRNYHFLKLTTDQGIVGWSEFDETFGSPGLAQVVARFAEALNGEDVNAHERIHHKLAAAVRPSPHGMTAAAFGAIENALLDAKAKAFGVPVHELLGGRLRDRVPVYWSHCASWRIDHPTFYSPAITDLDGVRAAGAEASQLGFSAVKTNMYLHDDSGVQRWTPGPGSLFGLDRNVDSRLIASVRAHLEALRDGAGDDIEIMIDLNFNAHPEGFRRLVDALADLDLCWIELDLHNPKALAEIRRRSSAPISSGESLFGVRQFLPYLHEGAVDVAIVDVIRNGAWQSLKIAALADGHDVNIAPHNYYSHLATMISLQLAAAVPNLRIVETDVDRIPWDQELFDEVPTIVDGSIAVTDRPGWGIEPIESAIRARPPR
jgi:L-alanine-DL-glutamate epimerase-like enolase superfamily enzyme